VTTTPNYAAAAGGSFARCRAMMAARRAVWRSFIFLPVKGISAAREGYALTYESCQESGKYDRFFASIRAQYGRR
jgi:hypothetical protein